MCICIVFPSYRMRLSLPRRVYILISIGLYKRDIIEFSNALFNNGTSQPKNGIISLSNSYFSPPSFLICLCSCPLSHIIPTAMTNDFLVFQFLIPDSPVSPVTSTLPLVFVLVSTAIKQVRKLVIYNYHKCAGWV